VGGAKFISSPPRRYRGTAMLGSHRERNPSRSENWHRRTTIYIPLPRCAISSSPSHPHEIPRNSVAGDWRWRPRALRDKLYQHTAAAPAATNLHEYTSSSSRPRNFRRYGREGGKYIKCIKYGSNQTPRSLRVMGCRVSRYEYNVRRYSNNRDSRC